MKRTDCKFSIYLLLFLTVFIACDSATETSLEEEASGENISEDPKEETPMDESSRITLEASADFLTGDGSGPQSWTSNVTLEAYKINGDPGQVLFETQFRDDGFGVAGGRWKQIDYYHEYQGEIVKASEKLVIRFTFPVSDVILQVGQMDPGEGKQAKEGNTCNDNKTKNKVDESGKWTAFATDGQQIGEGVLLDEHSLEGKLPDSMGSYRFLLDTGSKAISELVIEATQWGGEERGCPTYRSSYANEPLNDSGNTENNSEFNIMSISFLKEQ